MTEQERKVLYVLIATVFTAMNSVGVAMDAGVWLPVVDAVLGVVMAVFARAHVGK